MYQLVGPVSFFLWIDACLSLIPGYAFFMEAARTQGEDCSE